MIYDYYWCVSSDEIDHVKNAERQSLFFHLSVLSSISCAFRHVPDINRMLFFTAQTRISSHTYERGIFDNIYVLGICILFSFSFFGQNSVNKTKIELVYAKWQIIDRKKKFCGAELKLAADPQLSSSHAVIYLKLPRARSYADKTSAKFRRVIKLLSMTASSCLEAKVHKTYSTDKAHCITSGTKALKALKLEKITRFPFQTPMSVKNKTSSRKYKLSHNNTVSKREESWENLNQIKHAELQFEESEGQMRELVSTRLAISSADSMRSTGALYSSTCRSKVSSSSSGKAFKSIATIIQYERNSIATQDLLWRIYFSCSACHFSDQEQQLWQAKIKYC